MRGPRDGAGTSACIYYMPSARSPTRALLRGNRLLGQRRRPRFSTSSNPARRGTRTVGLGYDGVDLLPSTTPRGSGRLLVRRRCHPSPRRLPLRRLPPPRPSGNYLGATAPTYAGPHEPVGPASTRPPARRSCAHSSRHALRCLRDFNVDALRSTPSMRSSRGGRHLLAGRRRGRRSGANLYARWTSSPEPPNETAMVRRRPRVHGIPPSGRRRPTACTRVTVYPRATTRLAAAPIRCPTAPPTCAPGATRCFFPSALFDFPATSGAPRRLAPSTACFSSPTPDARPGRQPRHRRPDQRSAFRRSGRHRGRALPARPGYADDLHG